jgi:uncharacterized protein (TIGR00730 family)
MYARKLGRLLGQKQIRLIYGGGTHGLMGEVAQGVIAEGGEVKGVITEELNIVVMEKHPSGITEVQVVPDMHSRKKLLAEFADVAIVLPGGYGTMDEMFEFLTWNQLKIHKKPCGLLNLYGYFDPLILFLKHAKDRGFLTEEDFQLFCVAHEPKELLEKLNEQKDRLQ